MTKYYGLSMPGCIARLEQLRSPVIKGSDWKLSPAYDLIPAAPGLERSDGTWRCRTLRQRRQPAFPVNAISGGARTRLRHRRRDGRRRC